SGRRFRPRKSWLNRRNVFRPKLFDVKLEDLLQSLLEECRDDHVGLWRIVKAVRLDLGCRTPIEIRTMTVGLIRRLLEEHGALVGHPTADGREFVPWNLPPDQAVSRIEKEWSALGRDPNIGDVAWFTSTDSKAAAGSRT